MECRGYVLSRCYRQAAFPTFREEERSTQNVRCTTISFLKHEYLLFCRYEIITQKEKGTIMGWQKEFNGRTDYSKELPDDILLSE